MDEFYDWLATWRAEQRVLEAMRNLRNLDLPPEADWAVPVLIEVEQGDAINV